MDQREFSRRGGRARSKKLTKAEIQEQGRKGGIKSGKVRRKKAREKKKAEKAKQQQKENGE